MKMTAQEFADFCGLSKQAISQAKRRGVIKSLKDPDDRRNVVFETEDPINKEYFINAQLKNRAKEAAENKRKSSNASEQIDYIDDELNPAEINRRAKIAEMRKKEMQVEILEKKYIPTNYVEDFLFKYLERLNATIERQAGVFVSEIGQKILESGEITPAHIEEFVNINLEAIHNTKKQIIKDIEKYEPVL